MKLSNALFAAVVLMGLSSCQEETRYVEMISSTMDSPWQKVLDMEVPMFDMDLTLGVGDSTLFQRTGMDIAQLAQSARQRQHLP